MKRQIHIPIIAVDFDGTLVEHEYPRIGAEVEGAFTWLLALQKAGFRLALWTMRDGRQLAEAVEFCAARGVTFWAVNESSEQTWTKSPKLFANVYIDDEALGCPVRVRPGSDRASVDWGEVGPLIWQQLRLGLRYAPKQVSRP